MNNGKFDVEKWKAAQNTTESAQHSQQLVKGCNHHEQTLGEFASDCGDDESVWGYDGDVW